MLCHKGRSFCASSFSCRNTACDRWIDVTQPTELPVSFVEMRGAAECPGYIASDKNEGDRNAEAN